MPHAPRAKYLSEEKTPAAQKTSASLFRASRCTYICITKHKPKARRQPAGREKAERTGASPRRKRRKRKPTAASVRLGYSSIIKRKTETVILFNGVPICAWLAARRVGLQRLYDPQILFFSEFHHITDAAFLMSARQGAALRADSPVGCTDGGFYAVFPLFAITNFMFF